MDIFMFDTNNKSGFRHWNHKYIKPLLNREEISKSKADKVLDVFHTISVADALDHLGNDVDVVEIPNGQKLSLVKNSSSVNGFHNVALNIGDENDPSLRQSYQEGVATQRRARFIICRDSTTLEEEYPKTMQFKDKQADQVTSHLATVVIQDPNVDNIQHVKAGGTGGMNSVSSPKGGNSVNADGRTEANGGDVDKENNENLDGVTLSFKSRDQNENDAEDAKEENPTKGSFLARQDMPALSPQTATEMELPWKSSCEPIKVSHDSCDQDISQDNQITDSFLSLAVQDSTQSFALPISIDVSNCDDEDEEEPTPPVTATEMQLPWKQEILEPDKTATELELPWKSTSRQDSISAMSCSTRHSYDDFPMPAHMPTWVDNLSYSHLLESGSPYASPDATIIPKKKETKPSVQDLFGFFQQASNQLMENMNDKAEDQDQVDKKDSETTVTLSNQRSMSKASVLSSHCVSKECLPPSSKSTDNIPDSSGTLPLPWMSQASDFMPVTSHMAREQSDKSCNYLVSNHTLPPPSHHHVIIPTMHLTEASLSNVCSEDSDHKPLKTLPGSASAPDLPKHFHHIEHTFSSRDRLQSESIMEDIRIQEQLQSRVQEWLINSSPADDNGIVIDFYDQEKPELSSDNDADDESFEDDDEDWGDL